MEKKAKPAVMGRPPKKGKSRGGRPKERVQVSVRFDRMVMDLLRTYLERNKKAHITDLLERGALLALREAERLQPEYVNALASINDLGVEFMRDAQDMWIMRYLVKHRELPLRDRCYYEFHLKMARSVREWPGYAEALKMLTDRNVVMGDPDQSVPGMSKQSSTA